ncbi:MAG: sulfurtransferase TusA family protein [Agarilytica sp.]
MPLLKAKQGLARVAKGDIVQLIATDPASERDVRSFVELTAHELVDFQQEQQIYTYYIRKGINP